MTQTKIEWTDMTHQLTTGCTKVSPACLHCYAERMHGRLSGMGNPHYLQPFNVLNYWPQQIEKIAKLPAGKKVFINSMSDLFHEDVPDEFIFDAFEAMKRRPDITFQILTKRPERFSMLYTKDEGAEDIPNIWFGVTAENQAEADRRIPLLLQVPAAVRFVSIEPMLGPVNLHWCDWCGSLNTGSHDCYDEAGLDWVICGGETGPGARPMLPDWVRSLRDRCQKAGVPFFFKGWGKAGSIATRKKKADPEYRVLDGRTWDEFPVPEGIEGQE